MHADPADVSAALKKAEKQFKDQNWAEARDSYDHARELAGDWHSPEARLAVEGAVACSLRLNLWDDALTRSQDFVTQNQGRFEEAVGERFAAGIVLSVPHYGTKQGGTFLRGQYAQGVQVSSYKKDRKDAIRRYEHARDLLAALVKSMGATAENPNTDDRRKLLNTEQIGLDFDLVSALAGHDENGYGGGPWGWCFWWWGSWDAEPEEDSDAVDEADYEQPRWYGRYAGEQEKPTGLPLGADGQPRFFPTPDAYAATLGDGPKIRFLLGEVRTLDTSEARDDSAQALFRQAMICRGLYGPDAALQWTQMGLRYDRFGHPLPQGPDKDAVTKKFWELGDDEAIAIAGGALKVVTLPPAESPMALLAQIEKECPKSRLVPEAIYSRALYLQSRQEFPQAIAEYERLEAAFPKEKRSADAVAQIAAIRKSGVLLDATGVHLPGEKPVLGFTYRNTDAINFTARRFDLLGYIDASLKSLDNQNFWRINNIESQLFQDNDWKKFTGKTVEEWTEHVPRNEANRADAGKTLAPLTEPGAYIVEARAADGGEPSRVLVFVTDIAIVHKNLPRKGLIYIADARTGQPLADHAVRVVETWIEFDQPRQQNRFHVISNELKTDKDGAIEYARQQTRYGSNINAIVTDGENRMAFSFFQNWQESDWYDVNFENGPREYVITDRPVYRPGTTVQFRVWERNRANGGYYSPQPGRNLGIQIYDAKNNRLFEQSFPTDANGCISGEYPLPADAALGVYRFVSTARPRTHAIMRADCSAWRNTRSLNFP